MSEQGYVLDIDAQFLNRLKKADEELKKIIGSVDNVTGAFKNMLNTAGGINNNIFSNIINQVEKLGKTRVTANVDSSQLEKMMSTLTEIASTMGTMSKGGKELFDLGSLGNMNASLVETENKLKAVEERIAELKKKYNDDAFKEPINERTGKPYGKNTKTYKNAKETARNEVDANLRAEIETKAILERQLKFAKMTQDEKASYVQKKIAEILNAEKRAAEDVQKEYSATISKMVKIGGQYDKASKKNTDGSLDPQLEILKTQFDELNKRRMDMERTYGEYVVNVAADANAKIANFEIKRILDKKDAEQKAAQTAIQDEARKKAEIIKQYQEALRTKDELDKIHAKMAKETLASGGRTPSQADQAEIERQRAEVAAKIESIEQKHSDKIKDIVDKRNRDRIKSELDANREQVALTSRMQAQIRDIVSKAQKGSAWDTFKDSINPFKQGKMVDTKSIEEAVAAIDRLKAARERLNKEAMGDSSGRFQRGINRINQEIRRQEAYVERLRGAHRRLAQDAAKLKDILGRVFGLAALKGYASQLLRVRGEFEMAQRSLEVLLRNKGEANLLWKQTVDLAVKSPYTTQQLVTATKQLAAYRVESHKLYSTTKMLTDISAGLGVEINRLVLAYGQVKAANFLRGTELRQFSEAGVNLLDELAKHFTDIEGKSVTVQQVFDRISKRMVSFADVEAVLQRITSSGGMFYNMQEKQSETLKGQLLNLKDSVELMFNDMGKSADGFIKTIISGLKAMVDNWRIVGAVMGPVLTAFLSMKVFISIINGVRASVLALTKAVNSNPILFWAGVIASIASSIIALVSSVESVSEEFTSQLTVFENNTMMINGYAQATVNLTNRLNELQKVEEKSKEQERELIKLMATRSAALNELIGLNEEYGRSMSDAGNDVSKMNALMQEEQQRQVTTRNFIVNLEDVDISGLDKANAALATAEAKLAAMANMDLSKAPTAFARAVKESSGDIEKFKNLYASYLQTIDGWAESNAKSQSENIFTQMFDYDLGNDEAEEFWDDIKESFVASLESSNIETDFRNKIRLSFDRAQKEGIIAGLSKKEGREYQEAIALLQAQYYYMVEKAGEGLGPYGAVILNDELANMFGLTADWLSKTEPIAMEDWMISYNKALEGFVEKNSSLYQLLAATEQDTVSKRISAIKQEKAEKEALIATNLALIATSTDAAEKASLQASVDSAKKAVKAMKESLSLLGAKVGGRGGSGQDKWEKAVKTLKDVYSAYSKLADSFNKTTATEKLWKQWANVVNENLKAIGFTADKVREKFGDLNTKESLEKALNYIAEHGSAKGKKAAIELIAEVNLDFEISEQDKTLDRLSNSVEKMFDGYQLYIELSDIGVSDDLIKNLFDVDITSLDELNNELDKLSDEFGDLGDKGSEALKSFIDKLNELRDDEIKKEAKDFVEFLKKNLDEIDNIQKDGANKISIADKLFSENKIDASQYITAIQEIVGKVNSETSKIKLDKFKQSNLYIRAMGSLAAYTKDELKNLSNQLRDIISSNAGNIGVEELKEYNKAIKKIDKELEKFELPFNKTEIARITKYKDLQNEYNIEQEKHNALLKEKEELLQKQQEVLAELELQQMYLSEAEADNNNGAISSIQSMISSGQNAAKTIQTSLSNVNGELNMSSVKMENISSQMGEISQGAGGALMMVDAIIKEVYKTINAAIKVFNDAKDLAESFGKETDKGTWREATDAFTAIGNFNDEAMEGWENLKSGNVMGAVANTVGSILGLVTDINKAIDSDNEEKIKEQAKAIEELEEQYEDLGKKIEDAFTAIDIAKFTADSKQVLDSQIAATERMLELERDKKNSDEDRIKELEKKLKELTDTSEQLIEDMFSKLTGGILDDVLSTANSFVDAWHDAFVETGNGMKGLEETFSDMMANMLKQQASATLITPYINNIKKMLESFITESDPMLSVDEAESIRIYWDSIKDGLNENLSTLFDAFDFIDTTRGELSGLEKGIKGMTEDQAEVLASYWNSCRFILFNIDNTLTGIASNVLNSGNDRSNPIVEAIEKQTVVVTQIREMLSSIIGTGGYSSHGLSYLRVNDA